MRINDSANTMFARYNMVGLQKHAKINERHDTAKGQLQPKEKQISTSGILVPVTDSLFFWGWVWSA